MPAVNRTIETLLAGVTILALGVTIGKHWTQLTSAANYALVLATLVGAATVVIWYWAAMRQDRSKATPFALRYLCTAVFVLNVGMYRLLS